MQTNTTTPATSKGKYSAIAMLGNDLGVVEGKETGEYICKGTQNPEEFLSYYIFVPGSPNILLKSLSNKIVTKFDNFSNSSLK